MEALYEFDKERNKYLKKSFQLVKKSLVVKWGCYKKYDFIQKIKMRPTFSRKMQNNR
jgi:hypothetical protein